MNKAWLLKASGCLVGVSLLTFLIGLILVPIVVVRMPVDFFVRDDHEHHWHFPTTAAGWSVWIGRNLLGAFLILAGILMLLLPGQGILTIAAGLLTMTVPGKRRFVLWLVHWGRVQRSLNWIRKQAHQPPLEFSIRKRR